MTSVACEEHPAIPQKIDATTVQTSETARTEDNMSLVNILPVLKSPGVTEADRNASSNDNMQNMGAEAFAFVNVARFAVPLRIGLALSTTPWINDNVVEKLWWKDDKC